MPPRSGRDMIVCMNNDNDGVETTQCKKAKIFGEIRIEKYRKTRYWALWLGEELLAVTVYKKGAIAVKNILCCDGAN